MKACACGAPARENAYGQSCERWPQCSHIGTATRVTVAQARAHMAAGGAVLVSERGHRASLPVTRSTVVHTRKSTTWEALRAQVREWRHRHPGQRFYVVEYDS